MGARRKAAPVLLTHRTVAGMIDIDCGTLRDWVAQGLWPLPHSIITDRTWLFRADAVRHWLDTGSWPEGTAFRAGVGKGRGASPA